jgi:hypothetical protein
VPERYAIAFALALVGAGVSERKAFDLAVGLFEGKTVEPLVRGLSARLQTDVANVLTRRISFATIAGRASGLRAILRDAQTVPASRAWAIWMSMAFGVAMFGRHLDAGKQYIRELAMLAGEGPLAERFLIPILNEKFAARLFYEGRGSN